MESFGARLLHQKTVHLPFIVDANSAMYMNDLPT